MAFDTTSEFNTTANPRKNKTKFYNSFSEEVFNQTYKFANEKDINERHFKIAKNLASVESKEIKKYWESQFLDLLEDFKFVPGGRITSNAGTDLKGTTYINCFVSGFRGKNQDSMESIMDELKRQALILKSEGGYGFCANVMRPRGAYISGIGGDSPGAVKLLEMWDTQSSVITAGSGERKINKKGKNKIRKGAQMVTMSIWHPDIEEFITAKQQPGRLTKFNMSVLVTKNFMEALEQNDEWKLEFPDFEAEPEMYKEHWDGNLNNWRNLGYPTKVYKTFKKASELWDLIMLSTYNRNEPGVLFVDTINYWNNLYYEEYIQATNPCGEQVLPVGGVCLLGSFNLTQFIDKDKKKWDYTKLKKYIPIAVRFLDNVNDITSVPLPENQESLKTKRRIGLGIMGYASALMMMKIRYGSEDALKITEELANFIMNETYKSSASIAKEKGPFPLFDAKKYLDANFIKKLDENVREQILANGIRNSHLLSIQPTGNSSVLANNVSGGIEPVFSPEYVRTAMQPFAPIGLNVPKNIDWDAKHFEEVSTKWEWIKEGDDDLLRTTFNNEVWKLDKSRGLLKEAQIMDWAVRYHKENNTWDAQADWAVAAHDLGINDHINTLKIFSRYVDSAISKTVNLKKDFSFDRFKDLYLDIYKSGTIKGCTTYRDGTMASVLMRSSEKDTLGVQQTKATPRPKELKCDVFKVKSNGTQWIVLVGLFEETPYEVFALKQGSLHLSSRVQHGKLIKETQGVYHLETGDGWFLKTLESFLRRTNKRH